MSVVRLLCLAFTDTRSLLTMFPVGVSKAKEALIFGKKLDANALLDCGFVKYVALSSPLFDPENLNLRFP